MENSNNDKKQLIKVDDSEYVIDELPEQAKGLIAGLKTADAQTKLYEDTLRLISISKSKLVDELKEILENIEPIKNQ